MVLLKILFCIALLVLLVSWLKINPFITFLIVSLTHGFLPPHPSPTGLVNAFHADMGKTLIYGLMLAIPAIIVAGPLLSRTLKNIDAQPLATFRAEEIAEDKLPGAFSSFFTALL